MIDFRSARTIADDGDSGIALAGFAR